MQNYILNRIKIDAARTLSLAENDALIKHPGFKGRLRELLINNILIPWLPPYISCGTGMIISAEDIPRESTQDDVIIYDKSLVPPILVSQHAPEGLFLYNSVIAQIEVKSILDRGEIRKFVKASKELSMLKFTIQQGFDDSLFGPLNMLFAYSSDATGRNDPDYQLERIIDVMQEENVAPADGIVSAICIPGCGLWKIARKEEKVLWQGLSSSNKHDHITWFVAVISNTVYREHAKRQGRNPSKGLEGGIGMYIPGGEDIWRWI